LTQKGLHERQTDVSAQHAPSSSDARIPGPDEHEERPPRVEAAPCQGAKAFDRQQRITSISGPERQAFRPDERIRRRAEFQDIYKRGVRLHGRYCTAFILETDRPIGRLGVAATKKLGSAVVRNRAKRLIREIFRRNKLTPGYDVVVIPKSGLLNASLTVLEADYRTVMDRARRALGHSRV
jgi:ribonuclease P protein component